MPIVLACLEISWVEISTCPGGKRLRQYQKWLKIPIQGWSNHSHTPWPFNHDGRSPCSRQTSIFKNQENSNIFQPIAIFDSQRVSTPLYSLSWGQFSNPCPGPRRSCSSHSLPLSIVCPCRSSIERPMSPGRARRHQSTQSDQKIFGHLGAKILPQQYCLVQPSSQKILKRNEFQWISNRSVVEMSHNIPQSFHHRSWSEIHPKLRAICNSKTMNSCVEKVQTFDFASVTHLLGSVSLRSKNSNLAEVMKFDDSAGWKTLRYNTSSGCSPVSR